MKKFKALVPASLIPLIWIPFLCLIFSQSQCGKSPHADSILHHANLIAMTDTSSGETQATAPDAVAIKDGKIVAVGQRKTLLKKWQGKETELHDLMGKTLIPGFISSHMHFALYALMADWIDVSSINTFSNPSPPWKPVRKSSEIIAKVKAAAAKTPNQEEWIKLFAFDPSRQIEDVAINRESLDEAAPNHPVLLVNNSLHFAYVNSKALEKINICGTLINPKPEGCHDPHFSKTELKNAKKGILQELGMMFALEAAIPPDMESQVKKGIKAGKSLARQGYTTVSEGGANLELLNFYRELTQEEAFPQTVVALPLFSFFLDESENGYEAFTKNFQKKLDPKLKLGPIKFFADGSPQGYSAFLLQPYQSRPPWADPNQIYRGQANYPELLKTGIEKAQEQGLQVAVHVNGDASLEMVLDILEEAQKKFPRQDTRHQLIHVPFPTTNPDLDQLGRMKENGYVPTFLASNIHFWGKPLCDKIIGPDRTKKIYPVKSAKAAGLPFSLHSDAPVNIPNPLFNIWVAVTRQVQSWDGTYLADCPQVLGPDERITIADGLKAYTKNAAHQFFMEKTHGTIEPGKVADLVVLSDNPLAMESRPDDLLKIKVLATVKGGKFMPWETE